MSLIKTEKISYTYPVTEFDEAEEHIRSVPAISDISLEVEAGQFICILGSNGSGKSTFARHLNALLVPDEGTLWIDGINTRDDERVLDVRKNVGMVFQNPDNQIIGSIVDEDVAFGLENIGVPTQQMQVELDTALKNVGMEGYAKASPNNLSGGQKQRVAIAGILAMHPKCIVLDESTAMLDPRGRREVMDAVKELNGAHGITIISITHYMDEALEADKVFVMDGGKLVMAGTPKEIFAEPEELEKIGLRLPQISELAWELKKAGLEIPDGIISAEELMAAIVAIAGNK